jgi:hypothetical protein
MWHQVQGGQEVTVPLTHRANLYVNGMCHTVYYGAQLAYTDATSVATHHLSSQLPRHIQIHTVSKYKYDSFTTMSLAR